MIYAGEVTKIEQAEDGTPVCTVVNSAGNTFYPAFIASTAGGFDGVYIHLATEVGSQVILARANDNAPFFIIGGVPDVRNQTKVKTGAIIPPLTKDVDYNSLHVSETRIANTNASITLSPVEDLVIQAPTIRNQLKGEKFRVSQNGVANNQVLNAQPFINVLFAYLQTIQLKIALIETTSLKSATVLNDLTDAIIQALAVQGNADAKLTALATNISALADDLADLVTRSGDLALQDTLEDATVIQASAEATKNSDILIP